MLQILLLLFLSVSRSAISLAFPCLYNQNAMLPVTFSLSLSSCWSHALMSTLLHDFQFVPQTLYQFSLLERPNIRPWHEHVLYSVKAVSQWQMCCKKKTQFQPLLSPGTAGKHLGLKGRTEAVCYSKDISSMSGWPPYLHY